LIDEQLIFSEIDIQKLMNDRRKNTSFMELWRDNVREFRKVKFEIEEFEAENITRYVPPHPFVPSDGSSRDRRCSEIFAIQTSALAKRIRHTGLKRAVIGISGGLDSTLALLVTAKAFDLLNIPRKNIFGNYHAGLWNFRCDLYQRHGVYEVNGRGNTGNKY